VVGLMIQFSLDCLPFVAPGCCVGLVGFIVQNYIMTWIQFD
jgi:hypothetical protein